MSNNLDTGQARLIVVPVLRLNCLQRLSADDNDRQRIKFQQRGFIICNDSENPNSLEQSDMGLHYLPILSLGYLKLYMWIICNFHKFSSFNIVNKFQLHWDISCEAFQSNTALFGHTEEILKTTITITWNIINLNI